jgi:hypothetical protein
MESRRESEEKAFMNRETNEREVQASIDHFAATFLSYQYSYIYWRFSERRRWWWQHRVRWGEARRGEGARERREEGGQGEGETAERAERREVVTPHGAVKQAAFSTRLSLFSFFLSPLSPPSNCTSHSHQPSSIPLKASFPCALLPSLLPPSLHPTPYLNIVCHEAFPQPPSE